MWWQLPLPIFLFAFGAIGFFLALGGTIGGTRPIVRPPGRKSNIVLGAVSLIWIGVGLAIFVGTQGSNPVVRGIADPKPIIFSDIRMPSPQIIRGAASVVVDVQARHPGGKLLYYRWHTLHGEVERSDGQVAFYKVEADVTMDVLWVEVYDEEGKSDLAIVRVPIISENPGSPENP